MSTSFPIVLVAGHITAADELSIPAGRTRGQPQRDHDRLARKATPVRPDVYADCAAKIMRVVARANIGLARRRLR